MKAFVYEKYGPPETLRLAEVDKPAPDADHVLVKVRAASVNAADWHVLRGKPLFSRATLGLLRPKRQVLGVDIAGQVEAVGSGVTRFQPGDEVYANLLGLRVRRNAFGFLGFVLAYQMLMSPIAVVGYGQEFLGLRRRWK